MRKILLLSLLLLINAGANAQSKSCNRRIFGWYVPTKPLNLTQDRCRAFQGATQDNTQHIDVVSEGHGRLYDLCRAKNGHFIPSSPATGCLAHDNVLEPAGAFYLIEVYVEGTCHLPVPASDPCGADGAINMGKIHEVRVP